MTSGLASGPVIAASAPPRVLDRITSAPDGPVEVLHRGAHAVCVDLGGWCVGIVDQHAAALPCALGTRNAELARLGAGPAHVAAGVLHLSGVPLVVGRLRDVAVPRVQPGTLRALDALPTPRTVAPLHPAEVAGLVGAGDGLTPWADDVLCGWLALHRAVGLATPAVDAAIRASAHRTTLLSATLLDCAQRGEVLPQFATFVAALGSPALGRAEADLQAVGHSSGAGLLEGARWAAAEITARAAAA